MAEDVNNLVLEHLRAIRADLGGMRDTMQEQGQRLTRMEIGLAGLRHDQGADAGGVAEMGLRLDRLVNRSGELSTGLTLRTEMLRS